MKLRVAGLIAALWGAVWAADLRAPGAGGGELRFAVQSEPKALDPLLVQEEPSYILSWLTQGRLVRLNRVTQKVEGELALSWKTADKGRRLVFQLRPGVRFSDGAAFQAAHVCATVDRMIRLDSQSPIADGFRSDKGTITCRVDGPLTVSILFPEILPAPERLFDDLAIQPAAPSNGKLPPVLGPFQVAEQRAGAYLLLSRNPNYWKKDARGTALPYLDTLRIEIQRNRDAELIRFRKGEYHLVNNVDPELFERLKAEMPSAVRDAGGSIDTEQLWFNLVPKSPLPEYKKAWFRSVEFRRAISTAIRREDLVRVVFRGHATPAYGPVPESNRLWMNPALKPARADSKSALEILTRAGFQLRGGVLRDAAGNAVEFSLITNAGNKVRERMAALIQQDLASLGIKVNLVPLDFPSMIERITRTYQYEACLSGLTFTDLDPNAYLSVWLSSAPLHAWNPGQKKPSTEWEAEIDRLMLAQSAELDPRKRKAAYDKVQQIVAAQLPFIYLVNRNALVAVSPQVRNLQPAILRPQALWNLEEVSLGQGANR